MAATRLQDDLLQEFREERKAIDSQIELLEPLAASLKKPAAQRLAGKGLILFAEILCWALFLGALGACIFLNKLYPFYILSELSLHDYARLSDHDLEMLKGSVYALIILAGLLFIILARSLARIRQKENLVHLAASRIKTLLGHLYKRKEALDALEQKHFARPTTNITRSSDVNDVTNPAYDPNEDL